SGNGLSTAGLERTDNGHRLGSPSPSALPLHSKLPLAGPGPMGPSSSGGMATLIQPAARVQATPQPATVVVAEALELPEHHAHHLQHGKLTAVLPPTLRTALGALRRNKMRAALTALGIIIGVGAVITMMEIGQGSKAAIQASIASMGANSMMIQSGAA